MTEQLDLEDWLRENPKTLTEQWKKGELKSGWYFVKVGNYEAEIDLYDDDQNQWFNCCDKDIYPVEILAPVPSYEEWQKLIDTNDTIFRQIKDINSENYELEKQNLQLRKWCEEFNVLDVAKENQQLKELLNYIRDEIADMPATALQLGFGWISEAAYRIDKAIGEK